jgi:hypothetical protein
LIRRQNSPLNRQAARISGISWALKKRDSKGLGGGCSRRRAGPAVSGHVDAWCVSYVCLLIAVYARLQNVQLSAKNLLLSLQLQVYRDTLRREKKRPKISEWMRRLFVWTLRQTLLNYLVPLFSFSESVIRQRLLEYKIYFNEDRTHSANGLDSPLGRETPESPSFGKLVAIPCVGGLHHRYALVEKRAA